MAGDTDRGMLFMHCLWSVIVLVVATVGTIAFSTADWVVAGKAQAAPFLQSSIELGMINACMQSLLNGTQTCGRYGDSLDAIPHAAWRAAAFFYGIGLLLCWLVWVATIASCCFRSLQKVVRHFLAVGVLCTVVGVFCFGGGIADTNPTTSTGSPYSPCGNATAFNTGACAFDTSGILGVCAMALGLLATLFGYCLQDPFRGSASSFA